MRGDRRIYRQRRPLRAVLIALVSLIIIALMLTLSVFFGFKKYIVYTSDGVRLDVPWLRETVEEQTDDIDLYE